jgi:hypothetical protein
VHCVLAAACVPAAFEDFGTLCGSRWVLLCVWGQAAAAGRVPVGVWDAQQFVVCVRQCTRALQAGPVSSCCCCVCVLTVCVCVDMCIAAVLC